MATTYLSRTLGTPTSTKIGTLSVWFKRSKLDSEQNIFNSALDGNSRGYLQLDDGTNGTLHFWWEEGSTVTSLKTNRFFRDCSAWYHVVVAWDTSQGTASNRVKIYINGVQETSFATETYPPQDATTCPWNISGYDVSLGANFGGGGSYGSFYSGLMSYAAFIDGTQEAPTIFGETDATTGEWKIKTTITPSSAWGNNGFLILKDGNTITDQSSNSNNFTLGGGTLTNTEDNPDDVFSTMNPLDLKSGGAYTFSNGNTTVQQDISRGTLSTLATTSGKYYAEAKFISTSGSDCRIGIVGISNTANENPGIPATGYVYDQDGNKVNSNSASSFGDTYTTGDIIGIAVDLTNLKIYFAKNGTWQNSGDPESGATGTGAAYTITTASGTPAGFYFFTHCDVNTTNKVSWNFGNGYFGTTAISSEGTNASNIGKFEYNVPANYTALSLKGINS